MKKDDVTSFCTPIKIWWQCSHKVSEQLWGCCLCWPPSVKSDQTTPTQCWWSRCVKVLIHKYGFKINKKIHKKKRRTSSSAYLVHSRDFYANLPQAQCIFTCVCCSWKHKLSKALCFNLLSLDKNMTHDASLLVVSRWCDDIQWKHIYPYFGAVGMLHL